MKKSKKIGTILRGVLAGCLAALAAGVPRAAEHIEMHFDRIGIADGLSQSMVMAIEQDAEGFMWFGTENGLDRFDGFNFQNYRRDWDDPGSLQSEFVRDLDSAGDGSLWVATDGGGIAAWDPHNDRFLSYRHDEEDDNTISSDRVRKILVDEAGRVWVGTRDSGLNRLDPVTGDVVRLSPAEGGDRALRGNDVYALAVDGAGRIWVGTDAGLNVIDAESARLAPLTAGNEVPDVLRNGHIRALMFDRDGRLWIGTNREGVVRLDVDDGSVQRFGHDPEDHHTLPSHRVEVIYQDQDGRVWIGTDRGLSLVTPDGKTVSNYANYSGLSSSLSDNFVMSIYQDAGGILWIGTRSGGLNKWNPRSWSFGHHKPSGDIPDSGGKLNVTAFTEDASGRLWLGTFGAGIDLMERADGQYSHYEHDLLPPVSVGDNRIMTLLTDSRGTVWAGTMTGGLHSVDPDSMATRAYTNDPEDANSISANGIMALLEDREGNIWAGTFGGGASRFDPATETFVNYAHDPADETTLSGARATSLTEGSDGAIWVGTDGGGLSLREPGSDVWRRFLHDPEVKGTLPAKTVYALHTDAAGRIWIGTRAGLSRAIRDPAAPHGFVFEDASAVTDLPRRAIYSIESDRHGSLWLGTSQGLLRFDPATGASASFGETHGLQGDEFNFGASYGNAAGEVFFGGTNGFNVFDPDKLTFNRTPPRLALTSLSVLNEPADLDVPISQLGGLDLGYADDVVTFTVAALDYASPADNSFAYMLEGFDQDWVHAGNERRITYTNLDGGDYTLRVRASNSDGIWNPAGISLPISVAYPPWQTWWAYTGYAIAVLLSVLALVRHQQEKLRREAEYSRRLEQEVRSRTHQLKERNAELQNANTKLKEVSITDALTGLRNRRFVYEQIGRDVDLVLRHYRDGTETLKPGGNNDLLFLMVDLDNFKPVNDTCGHEAGDELLLQVRDVLLEACRYSDDVIRWGGDEFMIIARETNREYAATLAERIRTNLSQRVFSLGNGHVARISTSIGYATYPFIKERPELLTWEEVLGVADAAMYEAKQNRNAWVGIEGLTWSGSGGDLCRAVKDAPGELAEQGAIRAFHSLDDVQKATA
jgi:diguanylate cyclase (GGDEF)-like protein